MNSDITKVLGKKVSYTKLYDKEILVREKREINRVKYNISTPPSFTGVDTWHCYEISTLTEKGYPVNRVGKIVYSSDSKYIVESKSLKLYLNSFNMFKRGKNKEESVFLLRECIKKDLEELLETEVKVSLFTSQNMTSPYISFLPIEEFVDTGSVEFNSFNEAPSLLKIVKSRNIQEVKIRSDALRSNCKITGQADFGDIFLHYKGAYTLDLQSFLQYIVSFRGENHFHEEVVEMIYTRLFDILKPEELMVGAIYTRRGGIDICPSRASHAYLLDSNIIDSNVLTSKKLRQ